MKPRRPKVGITRPTKAPLDLLITACACPLGAYGNLLAVRVGLNRVARGFLHRRFAAMVRQFAVDGEIDRSEAEAAAVGGAVRLATARVDMYLTVSE